MFSNFLCQDIYSFSNIERFSFIELFMLYEKIFILQNASYQFATKYLKILESVLRFINIIDALQTLDIFNHFHGFLALLQRL